MHKVSVIIATYNPVLERVLFSINSVLKSVGIDYELIISDDGSRNNYFNEIEAYIKANGNCDYYLLSHEENKGTVSNCLDAVLHADGKYIREIGCGDAIYGAESLKNQVEFLENSNRKWSFGEMYYFSYDEKGSRHFVNHRTRPQILRPYEKSRDEECIWNYCVLNDIAIGPAILYERDIFLEYLKRLEGNVKYTEDMAAMLMVYDGFIGAYYSNPIVLYEFDADGLSAPDNYDGGDLVSVDHRNTYKMIADNSKDDECVRWRIGQIMHKRAERGRKKTDIIHEKGRLLFAVKYRINPRMTGMPNDTSCLRSIVF